MHFKIITSMNNQEIINIKIEDLVLWTENPRDPISPDSNDQDVADKAFEDLDGRSTFYNIGQMTQYRVDYLVWNQNRDKMIKHACLAGLEIIGLLAVGIAGLTSY